MANRTLRRFDVRASQGPLAGLILSATEMSDGTARVLPGAYAEELAAYRIENDALVWTGPAHDCDQYATYYESDEGALGHGWVCGCCGALLQVG